jgi:D-glycero-D-manno-heptose 1,7-bisphosphate phosphatase
MKPAVFLDRDNTLIVSDGYLGDASKVVLVEGAAEAIARLRGLGFAIAVVSNQSGIARGMFNEAATQAVNARLDKLLREQDAGAIIDAHEYCPHHPEAPVEKYRVECDCRKPKPGMLLKASRELGLDLARSWMVGDAPRDIEAGKAAGCRTVLFVDPSLAASPAQGEQVRVQPDFRVSSLREAVDVIEKALVQARS